MWIFDWYIEESISNKSKNCDPIDIFNSLDAWNLKDKLWIDSLRDYQTQILTSWYINSEIKKDFAIDLETWAWKTLIWLLIAESVRIKEKWKVIYLCVNKQLVDEVYDKWIKLGLKLSKYHWWKEAEKINEEDFLQGNSILITNYHAFFNQKSIYNDMIRNDEIKWIIYDDFHRFSEITTSLNSIIFSGDDYKDLMQFFIEEVKNTDLKEYLIWLLNWQFSENIDINISELCEIYKDLKKILVSKLWDKINKDFILNNLDKLFIWINNISIFIWPNYPLIFEIFKKPIFNIFLSATVFNKSFYLKYTWKNNIDLIKTWKSSELVSERLFLFVEQDSINYHDFIANNKSLIILSSETEIWMFNLLDENIINRELSVDQQIEAFKSDQETKSLILVNRLDWIDLKSVTKTCLIYSSFLQNFSIQEKIMHANYWDKQIYREKITNNLIQSVWRIVRWRWERWIFFIVNERLTKWLLNNENLIYMQESIKKQILWGLHISRSYNYDYENLEMTYEECKSWTKWWKEDYKKLMDSVKDDSIELNLKENSLIHIIMTIMKIVQNYLNLQLIL